jgi:predicted protein tyrosine phosphatase
MNVLFICSRNKWRSRTAETICKNTQGHAFRSAGTENNARIQVTQKLILWSDIIFVMEKKHRDRLQEKFREALSEKEVIVLDIPDEYPYMHPELIEILKASVSPYLMIRD